MILTGDTLLAMIHWLAVDTPFPSVTTALVEPNGLLAAGADLSQERLLSAYRQGIFPWYSLGKPILWWSPDPRMVLAPAAFRWHRSLRQRVKKGGFEFRLDTAFSEVVQACAAPREDAEGTWIVPEMQTAYQALHAAGYAHSAEIWVDGVLVGGLYGVAIGRMFYGESMFSRMTDGSKLALALLCERLVAWGFGLIDCQMETAHLASLGARPMARAAFLQRVAALTTYPDVPWGR